MGQNNNGNGNPPKVELELNQEARLKILKPVYEGKNNYGKFFLYSVTDLNSGEIKSLFAPDEIHTIIQEQKLGVGSEFLLKRVENGKKGSSKLELSILGKPPVEEQPDQFREMMRQCIIDAMEIKKSIDGIDLTHEDIRSLSSTLFIARSRACQ